MRRVGRSHLHQCAVLSHLFISLRPIESKRLLPTQQVRNLTPLSHDTTRIQTSN